MTHHPTPPTETPEEIAKRGGRTAMLVIGGLILCSTVIAIIAYGKFVDSEKNLHQDFEEMRAKGETLTISECVDEVLVWRHSCDAMVFLCDRSIGRMMEMCMDGQDRSAYCAAMDTKEMTRTTFGYAECKAKGAHKNRQTKKQCGTTWRAVAAWCTSIESRRRQSAEASL
jgi:hypothetical protein